jgi:hypothetical protein
LILRPARAGVFPVQVEFLHDITGRLLGIARTTISVT